MPASVAATSPGLGQPPREPARRNDRRCRGSPLTDGRIRINCVSENLDSDQYLSVARQAETADTRSLLLSAMRQPNAENTGPSLTP